MSGGSLAGIRVLDLSRVLAGPSCTQLLGDLGAEIIKVERPGVGDETRTWGPPYVKDGDGRDTTESGYYLCCNRNKRSIAVDFSKPEGVATIKQLVQRCDVLIENFKLGGLQKLGLGYEDLHREQPRLVYCSITGYGQTGPYAARPGYDMVAQGIGGLISMTGEPDRPPVKVPIAVSDVMAGLYAAIGILSALRHRDATGIGQHIDLGLLDVQVGWLYNQGLNYLTGGGIPQRLGTAHPNTVPYQVFETKDGWAIVAANNDGQFKRLCDAARRPELSSDARFATNSDRVRNRDKLVELVTEFLRTNTTAYWMEVLERANVPCSPVNNVAEVFADPQVLARGMKISMPHGLSGSGTVDLIGCPLKMSETPVEYRRAPPTLGEHTEDVLREVLELPNSKIEALRASGII
ncbi:MAG: CoA transferase [Alphaproteobacteria bacterium 64-6]|nr:MAG: CoA transferase [Alphaproteobacteria bacterium 64-6]